MSKLKTLIGLGIISISSAFAIHSGLTGTEDIVVFNFDGSSSMRPLIESLLDLYSSKQTSRVSFNVSAIGSNSGLKKVLNGTSEFALISHDISHLPTHQNYKDIWQEKQLKTITLAYEAMVLLYKTSNSCTSPLTLNKQNIFQLYSLLSGYRAPSVIIKEITFNDLLDNPSEDCNSLVYPWVKSTGPSKSGTAKAFLDNPLLINNCQDKECKEWLEKAKSGYGEDFHLNYVPESTSLHWGSFKNNLRPGAITYLPSHFVLQNWEKIESKDIKIADFKDTSVIKWTRDTIAKDHPWKRSFNIVYSTLDIETNKKKKELLEFLVSQPEALKNLNLSPAEHKDLDLSKPDLIKIP